MEKQNNAETMIAKPKKKGKVIVGIIIIACVVVAAAVIACMYLFGSPAEKTVRSFMEAFKNDKYAEMMNYCDADAFDDDEFGIFSYAGTNIIDYQIKSVSGPYKFKEQLVVEKTDYDDDEDFQRYKKFNDTRAEVDGEKYGVKYIVIEDTQDRYVLESDKEILDEYRFSLDVQYSTLLGNTKRNLVFITVRQIHIGSNDYRITEMSGIIH